MTNPAFSSRLRVPGLVGLVSLALSLSACSEPAPEVAFAPVEPGAIEVTTAPSIFGATDLSEIVISPLSADPEFQRANRRATVAKAAPATQPETADGDAVAKADDAGPSRAWLDGMTRAQEAGATGEDAAEPAVPELTAAMGAGIATEGTEFSPDFAPMRKSFASRNASAAGSDRVASLGTADVRGSGAAAHSRDVKKEMSDAPTILEADDIKRIVSRQRARVRACYERALKTETKLEGRLNMAWSVTPAGSVESVRVVDDQLGSDFVAKCVTHAVSQFRFPRTAEPTEIEYPMVFEPGKTF